MIKTFEYVLTMNTVQIKSLIEKSKHIKDTGIYNI